MIVTLSEQILSIKNDIFWNGNVYSVKCGWGSGKVTGIAKKYILYRCTGVDHETSLSSVP